MWTSDEASTAAVVHSCGSGVLATMRVNDRNGILLCITLYLFDPTAGSPGRVAGCPSIRAKALSRDTSPQQCSQHRVAAREVRTKALEMSRRIISR